MNKQNNGMFGFSIVLLTLSAFMFASLVIFRSEGIGLLIPLFMVSIPLFVLSNIALIKGITYLVRKIPYSLETVIIASIAVVLIIINFVCLCFLIGTGRLPHEIFY